MDLIAQRQKLHLLRRIAFVSLGRRKQLLGDLYQIRSHCYRNPKAVSVYIVLVCQPRCLRPVKNDGRAVAGD